MKLLVVFSYLLLAACGQPTQGPPGKDGSSCSVQTIQANTVLLNGGSLIQCTDGTSNLVSNGMNGSPGTVVAPLQFCPGTPSYPSKFIEVGFIINGSVYAVYSQNGGFMTLIPPGNYTSDGIGSSCNFTLNSNNTVTN
jgi:hypothetical protein